MTTVQAKKWIQDITKEPIVGFRVHQIVYLDIRVYGDGWYNKLQLPDSDDIIYVSEFKITRYTKRRVEMINPLTKDNHSFSAYDLYCFVHTRHDPSTMVIIDEAFMVKYPQVTQE